MIDKVDLLDLDRSRFGKDPFTSEERIIRLNRIFDATLCWLEESVSKANPKGTGAATMILERVELLLSSIERARSSSTGNKIILEFEPVEDAKEDTSDPVQA